MGSRLPGGRGNGGVASAILGLATTVASVIDSDPSELSETIEITSFIRSDVFKESFFNSGAVWCWVFRLRPFSGLGSGAAWFRRGGPPPPPPPPLPLSPWPPIACLQCLHRLFPSFPSCQ